jgi:hypothetical protein
MEKGVINMEEFRETEEFVSGIGVKIAFVQVKLAESCQEAWNRHLKENPNAALATLRFSNPDSALPSYSQLSTDRQ